MPDPAPTRLPCPRLGRDVELTRESELRIEAHHPDLLPRHRLELAEALAEPDVVRRGVGASLLLSRWYGDLGRGRHVVVVTVGGPEICRIVTAYLARRISEGATSWPPG